MKAFRTIFTSLFLALSAILAMTSCNNTANQDKQANQSAADTIKKDVNLSPENRNLLYQFPTPFEVTMMLQRAKAGFIFNITNSPANVTKYSTEKAKALNLGVYSADLAYSSTYNYVDETNKFIACTGKLANDLGIAGVYDPGIVERVKKFNNNKDSLVNMVTKIFNGTNDFLSKNNRNQIAVLVAAGTFVEALYLTASLNQVAADNKAISTVIFKQKENLDKLITILTAYNMDSELKPVGDEVSKLKAIYTNYGLEADKKLPQGKAAEIGDLTQSVRDSFIK
ncbi:MAG: hypothetical protein NTX43_09675 [Bacteroidetes bacterium]|nr:hypothetical protein [Bacteroidota bacterium]